LAAAFFLVAVLLPAVVPCGAGAASAPTTKANANAKAITCFISPPESFKLQKWTAGKNIGATFCVPFVQVSGTVDASWSLLKIDEYLVNPE
jgi:hypothetical protein